jgi:ubiquitin-like 1-activating enzyme E1 B
MTLSITRNLKQMVRLFLMVAEELTRLKLEAEELAKIKVSVGTPDAEKLVFEKVFERDIKNLANMEDLWTSRKRPTPLNYKSLSLKTKNLEIVDRHLLPFDINVWSLEESISIFFETLKDLGSQLKSIQTKDVLVFFIKGCWIYRI